MAVNPGSRRDTREELGVGWSGVGRGTDQRPPLGKGASERAEGMKVSVSERAGHSPGNVSNWGIETGM